MAKASQQVIISLPDKEDIVALAVVRQEAQAEVARKLISMALPKLKQASARDLGDLYEALNTFGLDREAKVRALTEMATVRTRADGVRRALTLNDLIGREQFPWPSVRGETAKPAA